MTGKPPEEKQQKKRTFFLVVDGRSENIGARRGLCLEALIDSGVEADLEFLEGLSLGEDWAEA